MSAMDALLDALDESREQLLVTIEPLPDGALLEKGAVGEWSIADALINLTAWEAELVTGLMRLDQGKRPSRLLDALADPQAYDQLRYAETQDRDLDQVFDDLQLVRVQTEDWLAGISEKQLTKKQKRLQGQTIASLVTATTSEREQQMLPALTAFAATWLAAEAAEPQEVIPLAAIDLEPTEDNHDNPD